MSKFGGSKLIRRAVAFQALLQTVAHLWGVDKGGWGLREVARGS